MQEQDAYDELIQELCRVKSENKRLTDLLTIFSRNLSEFKQMQYEEEEMSRTRKRKADDQNQNLQNVSPKHKMCRGDLPNAITSNISRVYVRIDPSDVSLVRVLDHILFHQCMLYLFIILLRVK